MADKMAAELQFCCCLASGTRSKTGISWCQNLHKNVCNVKTDGRHLGNGPKFKKQDGGQNGAKHNFVAV